MPSTMQRVAVNLKRIRTARGLSQQALAAKVKTTRVYVAMIEGAIIAREVMACTASVIASGRTTPFMRCITPGERR